MPPSEISDLFSLSDFVVQRPSPSQGAGLGPWTLQAHSFPRGGPLSEQLRFALGYALLAPSIRNTQPWRFHLRCHDDRRARLELRLDRSRVLAVADPDGRAATISCGAALTALTLALSQLGPIPHTLELLPSDDDDALLARIHVDTGAPAPAPLPPESQWMFQCLPKRRTLRGPMAARPISARLLERLQAVATRDGVSLHPLLPGDPRRAALVELIEEGEALQAADLAFQAELARWTLSPGAASEGRASGLRPDPGGRTFATIPTEAEGPAARPRPARGEDLSEGSPVMAILATERDTPRDWLRAGDALLRLLLRGRVDHVWASYFGQPLERPALRRRLAALLHELPEETLNTTPENTPNPLHPQVALRLGHGGEVPPSPRRALEDVLEQETA